MFERLRETLSPLGVPVHPSIVDAIKRDHDDLKELIEILKDEEVGFAEKKKLYADFASLLKSHSTSEEKAVYAACLKVEELRALAFEGAEEHHLADELMTKLQNTRSRDQWMARVKVLAELVERHILDEERDLLPEIVENIEELDEKKIVDQFLDLRQRSQRTVHQDNAGVLEKLM